MADDLDPPAVSPPSWRASLLSFRRALRDLRGRLAHAAVRGLKYPTFGIRNNLVVRQLQDKVVRPLESQLDSIHEAGKRFTDEEPLANLKLEILEDLDPRLQARYCRNARVAWWCGLVVFLAGCLSVMRAGLASEGHFMGGLGAVAVFLLGATTMFRTSRDYYSMHDLRMLSMKHWFANVEDYWVPYPAGNERRGALVAVIAGLLVCFFPLLRVVF